MIHVCTFTNYMLTLNLIYETHILVQGVLNCDYQVCKGQQLAHICLNLATFALEL